MATDPYADLRVRIHGRRKVPELDPTRPFKRRGAPESEPPSPSPCPTCPNSARCNGAELACTALELFENTRRYSPVAPRQPSQETWLRLYGPDDE